MTLAAAQVIDAVATRLGGVASTAGRVYTSRAWPLATLPAWRVVAASEAVASDTLEPIQRHELDIEARGVVAATEDVDAAMHALTAEGLAVLFDPPTDHELELTGIEREMQSENGATVGVARLLLRATFHTVPADPETIY